MASQSIFRIMASILVLAILLPKTIRANDDLASLSALRKARKSLALKKRFVANNDGCDCLYYPNSAKVSPQHFLKQRTIGMAKSQVNTLSYCTISSGFGLFTHRTKVGAILKHSASEFGIAPDKKNIASDLIAMNTDPLELIVDFGHQHDQEVFWSMRMNDTHDVNHRPDNPYFLFPQLKMDHPDWLVGNSKQRTPYCR